MTWKSSRSTIWVTPTMAHLLKYDSNYGSSPAQWKSTDGLLVNGKQIKALSEKDPGKLPWGDLGVDIVIEGTGVFRNKEKCQPHIDAGAKKVIITAPGKGAVDLTIVLGVKTINTIPPSTHRLERILHHQLPRPGGESRA